MTKKELTMRVDALKSQTKTALQTLFDNVNKGQRQQLVKIAEIKELFDRYGVDYEEDK